MKRAEEELSEEGGSKGAREGNIKGGILREGGREGGREREGGRGGRVDEGNERGRDGTRYGRREG